MRCQDKSAYEVCRRSRNALCMKGFPAIKRTVLDNWVYCRLIGRSMDEQHRSFFDKLAGEWDLTFTAEDMERLSRLVQRLPIKTGFHVLDLGCGTGALFDLLRRRVGKSGTVTGVDFSFRMTEKAHRNFPFENVDVVDADVTHLPFRDSCFDMAVAFSSFPHFAERQDALNEVHRTLKSGAMLYIIHLQSSKELAALHHRVGGPVADDSLPDAKEMRNLFHSGGFEKIDIEDKPGLYLASAVCTK
jgi:SAM-dependent methyltransferase